MDESNFTPYAVIPKASLDLSIGGSGGSLGGGAGGRIGLNVPLENGNFNVGISGQGSFNPMQGVNVKPTGIDASYTTGADTFKAAFEQLSPQDKAIFINYIKSF